MSDREKWEAFCAGRNDMPDGFECHYDDARGGLHLAKKVDQPMMCGWRTRRFRLDPGRYYRFSASVTSTAYGFWEMQFFDAADATEPVDFFSSGYPDTCGTEREFEWFFCGKHLAQDCRLTIWPGAVGESSLSQLQLRPACDDEAWEWFKAHMKQLPPLPHEPQSDASCGTHVAGTRQKFEARSNGSVVDVASYGDSVGFDVGNLPLELALERACPGASVHMHTRGKGSAGWDLLGEPAVLKERVLDIDPDLLICLGVSTIPEDILTTLPSLVDAVRSGGDTEVILMTNHRGTGPENDERGAEHWDACADAVRQVAEQEDCELVDFRAVMKRLIGEARPPADRLRWFMRDSSCHLNTRGRAVVLELLLRHLAPDTTPTEL